MRWIRHKAVTTVAAAVVLAGVVTVLLAACGHASAPSHAPQLRSPFTGEPVPSLNRVLAVKIDNIVNARPQTGLTHADIVYVLPVEGGLSRFLAIFSSDYPPPRARSGSSSPTGRGESAGAWFSHAHARPYPYRDGDL
jgi:hypothetical protein